MKAFIIYLKEIQSTIDAALECKRTAREHGLDAWFFEGFTPSRADEFIKKENLKMYDPGPKLFKIKNKKGGVRGCMISHLHLWKKCIEIDQPIVILEHDAQVVSDTYNQSFKDVLHLDAHRFIDPDPDLGKPAWVEKHNHYRKGEQQLKGAYGYVIKPHAAEKLVQGAYTDGITAADMFVKDKYVSIEVVRPRAVRVTSKNSLTVDKSFYM